MSPSHDPAVHTASPSEHTLMANALRALAMDAVEQANSGHPGMPLGMADVATVLFRDFLRYAPQHPLWPDRDRFVLSAGHGSMLLYGALHLMGVEAFTLEQVRTFRSLGSLCAGHPEYGHGVETTTGPLGQGLGNAVGMAMAEAHLRAQFGEELVSHHTYVLAGDGCLMEGISHEAASLAGHQRLGRLIVLFDDNGISIDGPVSLTCSDDPLHRFASYGWHTERVDGHDPAAVASALQAAQSSDRPTLIACRTTIGYGAPEGLEGSAKTHGAPLGAEAVAAARARLDWPHPPFEIPEAVRTLWHTCGRRGEHQRKQWQKRLEASPQRGAFTRRTEGRLPEGWKEALGSLDVDGAKLATRVASQKVLDALGARIPELVGGSADLTGSNNTRSKGAEVMDADNPGGRYVHYGVREHGMAAAMNGMNLHGGVIAFGGTFLVFSDYCRPALRLAAMMGVGSIFVFTHDSIGLGEDGPTHQPIEHLASLRAIPNTVVLRPCDIVETAECWALALERRDGPSCLALSRQGLPQLREPPSRGALDIHDNRSAKGGYRLWEGAGAHSLTLIASGSEVQLALEAARQVKGAVVVSMPSLELFRALPLVEQEVILGTVPRVVVEAGVRQGWEGVLREGDRFVGLEGFGASGPGDAVYAHFGLTTEAILQHAHELVR